MLKSMCTVLVEYAILVDWKHKQAHAPARLHSDTWMHAGEYYSDCILYTSNICADHTYTQNLWCANNVYLYNKDMKQPYLNVTVM